MFCSLFDQMDNNNYQQAGDLTDVIRASSAAGLSSEFSLDPSSGDRRLWPHLPVDDSSMSFGDPLMFSTGSSARDPFPHPHFSAFNFASDGGGGVGLAAADRPCNIFSRMLQISPSSKVGGGVISTPPCDSPAAVGNSPGSTSTTKAPPSSGSNPLCLMDNSELQISPPRNPAIKRRKSQVKKVVCIPAPAPANSRSSSGEVVPSDLWAWRKYGQKPIKGSPYPRCSSSKGCSARKQVERSRTDPNMLVITYTSEHNHPWPTQRNALAGSTRSHPSRTSASTPITTAIAHKTNPKHEHNNKNLVTTVKEEEMDEDQTARKQQQQQQTNIERREIIRSSPYDLIFAEFANQMNDRDNHHHHHDHHHLADPMDNNLLLFSSHGFSIGNDEERSKDPFLELYDWAENSNGSLFKEAKGG